MTTEYRFRFSQFRLFLLVLACFVVGRNVSAQKSVRDSSISMTMIGAIVGVQSPGGDLSDRFGTNFNIGGTFQYKTRTNFLFGVDGYFLFGPDVKDEGLLRYFLNSSGAITGLDGQFANILLYERGMKFDLKAGRIFPVIGPNPNSGITLTLGAGWIQHKIRIDNKSEAIPALSGDYLKGYDRLTGGFALTGFAGYTNFGNKRLVNFFLGVEVTRGFTHNLRRFNFDTREQDDRLRNDLFFGIRGGWLFPLYRRSPRAYYYN